MIRYLHDRKLCIKLADTVKVSSDKIESKIHMVLSFFRILQSPTEQANPEASRCLPKYAISEFIISVAPVASFSTIMPGLGAPKINWPIPVLEPLIVA